MIQKKILIPSYDFKPALGGVANYVHEVATSWAKLGHKVTVLARTQEGDKAFDEQVPYTVVRIPTPQTAILTLPMFSKNIRWLSETLEPDFIFCPLWFPDGAATYLSRVKTIPFFLAAHGSEVFLTKDSLKHTVRTVFLGILQKGVFSSAKKIFAVSNYTKNALHALPGVRPNSVIVANNGVNPDVFYKKHLEFPLEPSLKGKKLLLTVTRLHAYKGVDSVLKALPHVIKNVPDTHYLVVGKGPDRERLEALAKDLGVSAHVTFLGAVSYEQVIDLYNTATLFVLLSREELPDVEGFGLVFLEAAACGLPSLGGHSGGIPDAIDDMRSGWLVDPTSISDIEVKLTNLLSSPQILKSAAEYGLETAPLRTWETTARTILENIYEN
ncbi:MAG: glycosyltransferase family 4 protein [Bdellovibrionales bacterium]|nr:glycosyltransferase family 4 protein [Bdellovibrionales bacterium]